MKHIRWKGGERVRTKVDGGRRYEGREKWNERETRLSRPSKTLEGREERLLHTRDVEELCEGL